MWLRSALTGRGSDQYIINTNFWGFFMPTIAFKSRIRTVSDTCTLDLLVSHRLVAGEPSAAPRVVKNLPPKGLAIVLVSPLTIRTTGMLNNRKISAEGLMSSCIAQHLLEYLKSVAHPSTCPYQLTFSRIPASLGSKSSPIHILRKILAF